MDITIREYQSKDLDQITALENKLFSLPWSRESLKNSCEDGLCWVMETNSLMIIAYLIGKMVLDEFSIYNIAVCNASQKQGYGFRFITFLKEWLVERNCKKIFLEVRSQNHAAIGLYKKSGFRSIYIRRNYYQKPVDDAVTMSLSFDQGDRTNEKL